MLAIIYRTLTNIGGPFITLYLRRRLAQGREDSERFSERFGHPSHPRPEGRLAWCHAASVGEAASLLYLMDKMRAAHSDLTFLLTTGTVTAARMIAPRLPSYAIHQYMPIDRVACVTRFLDHWQPTIAIWVESELWPNTLEALRARQIPTALLNARMSDKSFRTWHRAKTWSKEIMSTFSLCLAQTEDDRGRFIALGARPVKRISNLKYASHPLPCDEQELCELQERIGSRPLWLMASTHRGEEEMAIVAHKALVESRSNIVSVIVPRHAVRGEEIARLLTAVGIKFARRSKGEIISDQTQVYLADTMGELGLFYRLCPVVVLGGSFVHVGGHNPIEPAQLGAAIIIGPHMFNFTEITQEFLRAQAAIQLKHDNEIAFNVDRLLSDVNEREHRARAARYLADQKRYVLDQIVMELDPLLTKKAA